MTGDSVGLKVGRKVTMRRYESSGSDDLNEFPSAPPPPSISHIYNEDTNYIPPHWADGVPHASRSHSTVPLPAAIWSGSRTGLPATPRARNAMYDVYAYTPTAALHHNDLPGGVNYRGPSPPGQSPTKTPLVSPDRVPSDYDVEAAMRGGKGNGRGRGKGEGLNLPKPGMPPCKAEAMKERRKKQLQTCDKDAFGVPLPKTARQFSLFASPFSIAEVCTGLGVYFASLQAAVVLAILLSICCIYPLVDNLTSQRWGPNYNLILSKGGAAAASCPKRWAISSWMTDTSIGGHCTNSVYTSPYDCSSNCVWDPSQLHQAQCRDVSTPIAPSPPPASGNSSGKLPPTLPAVCSQHLPCVTHRLDPTAPDGPCFCCRMVLDKVVISKNSKVSAGQLWTFFLAQLIFMGWMLYLLHVQLRAVHVQGSSVIGASDFSVWISGIVKHRTLDDLLTHWCTQFGPVVAAFNVPSVGDALRVGRRVADLRMKHLEAAALEGSTSWNPLAWCYRRFAIGSLHSLEAALEKQERKLTIYERQESEPTGHALATFEFAEDASRAVARFDRAPPRVLLDWSTMGLTNATPKLHGSLVNLVRAPEPSDLLWEHTNCNQTTIVVRRIWSWVLTTLIILAAASIQYGLTMIAQHMRDERMRSEYAAGNGESWAIKAATSTTVRLRLVSIVNAVVVVSLNLTIMVTVRALSWYERWTTRTSMERWVMLRLSVSQLLNAFAAPMVAAYVSGNRSGWFSRGGLIEAAFYVQCANAVMPPLFHLMGTLDKLRWMLSPFARTQAMLNFWLAPPLFPLAEQHAASITTLGLAMFYMPVLPISPMIAVLGLSFSYCANKWIALRRAAAPPNLSGMVTSSVNWMLRLLPLIQLILMKELYFRGYSTVEPVFYAGLAFWALFMLAPLRVLMGMVKRQRRYPSRGAGMSYHSLLGGKRLGPGEVYAPIVPKPCSRQFKEKVATTFARLAPAAFESIINGEEIVNNLFRRSVVGSPEWDRAGEHEVAGRLASGMHGTLSLLWQPQDPDHPQDIFDGPNTVSNPQSAASSPNVSSQAGATPPLYSDHHGCPPAVYATPTQFLRNERDYQRQYGRPSPLSGVQATEGRVRATPPLNPATSGTTPPQGEAFGPLGAAMQARSASSFVSVPMSPYTSPYSQSRRART